MEQFSSVLELIPAEWNAEGEIVTPNVTLRLVSSTSEERPNRGRVEVFHGSEWGTVCDDIAGVEAAMVICRYLGFTTGTPRPGAYFGAGSGKIWLDNLQCQGDEGSLEECYHHIWGENDCDHSEDFGVECSKVKHYWSSAYCHVLIPVDAITDATTSTDSTVQPEDGVIALVNGTKIGEGRVEIFHDGEWGTVCDDNFDEHTASVVCRSLGYYDGWARREAYFGSGKGVIWLDGFGCFGTEATLTECQGINFGSNDCSHSEDAGVACFMKEGMEFGVRLADGESDDIGRLEVRHNGEWGTVCNDGFGEQEAEVVCRSLGFSGGSILPFHRIYLEIGLGSGKIWLEWVSCEGDETSLEDCRHRDWGLHDCEHIEDVAVACNTGSDEESREEEELSEYEYEYEYGYGTGSYYYSSP
ncbi:hypothetical protein CAPTEDRAFT_195254 [Capitella teleta]|uniref:SRCR domain-containing protein n=1 Tax=Capitella teleta TaxID=283909 RepID=R7TQJ5_CAPTE|nr:hypothetical protein CAPTEDRAFT_195254 [Capitella teleta]|eukprot:ELT95807.1 hypothetical protein CAPTEDRAFT_195254 [Capitella teleta]